MERGKDTEAGLIPDMDRIEANLLPGMDYKS